MENDAQKLMKSAICMKLKRSMYCVSKTKKIGVVNKKRPSLLRKPVGPHVFLRRMESVFSKFILILHYKKPA